MLLGGLEGREHPDLNLATKNLNPTKVCPKRTLLKFRYLILEILFFGIVLLSVCWWPMVTLVLVTSTSTRPKVVHRPPTEGVLVLVLITSISIY